MEAGNEPRPCPTGARSTTAVLSLPTLEEALKRYTGHKLPTNMRAVAVEAADGATCVQIAQKLKIQAELVGSYIKAATQFLRCQIPESARIGEYGKKWAKIQTLLSTLAPTPEQEVAETNCRGCGTKLEVDEWRLVVRGVVLAWDGGECAHERRYLPDAIYYCENCAINLKEFTLPSVLYVAKQQEEVTARTAQEDAAWNTLLQDENARYRTIESRQGEETKAKEQEAKEHLALGDTHPFNKLMPTTPVRGDAMAMAVFASQIDRRAKEAEHSEIPGSRGLPTFDELASMDPPDSPLPQVCTSGEAVQRRTVLNYLNSPRSRTEFKENQRSALRMWAEGASQNEVAQKVGMSQGTFSKLKNAALGKAHAGR